MSPAAQSVLGQYSYRNVIETLIKSKFCSFFLFCYLNEKKSDEREYYGLFQYDNSRTKTALPDEPKIRVDLTTECLDELAKPELPYWSRADARIAGGAQ